MAGLTQEEQEFFESGGDTSKLGITEVSTPPSAVDLAGLGNTDPPAPDPVVAAPAPAVIAPVAATPDPTDFLRNQLAAAQQQAANLQAQLQAAQAPKTVASPAPDPTTDPLGSMLHQLDAVNKNVADLQAHIAEQQNQANNTAAFQRFQQQVLTLRDQFATTHADFATAYQHLRDSRMADLRSFGFQEADVQRTVFQEEIALSQAAIQQGKNPAEAIYDMAKRHGYTAAPGTTPVINNTKPATSPDQKLAVIKQGIAGAQPSLPASRVIEDITAESLRDASDSDLNKLVSDPGAWAKIAGTDKHPI